MRADVFKGIDSIIRHAKVRTCITKFVFSQVTLLLSVILKHKPCMKKVQVQGFSGPYFSAFELNTGCGKIRTRKNSVFGHFSRSKTSSNYNNGSTVVKLLVKNRKDKNQVIKYEFMES